MAEWYDVTVKSEVLCNIIEDSIYNGHSEDDLIKIIRKTILNITDIEIDNCINDFKERRELFLICETEGHDFELIHSWATPDSGGEIFKCNRCGKEEKGYCY